MAQGGGEVIDEREGHWVIQITIEPSSRDFLKNEASSESRTINRHISHILKKHIKESRKAAGK